MSPATTPLCAVGAIVLHEGAILLVKRDREPSRGLWSLPGGRVQTGESLIEAVAREVKEETGLDVAVGDFCGIAEWISRDDDGGIAHHYVILDFYAKPHGPTQLKPGDDAADARWVHVDELPELTVTTGLVEFLTDRGVIARGKARIPR